MSRSSPTPTDAALDRVLVDLVAEAEGSVPLTDLVRGTMAATGASRCDVRAAVHRLVQGQVLEYVHRLGMDGVGPAFGRPVRVSHRLELTPAGMATEPDAGCLPVILSPGAAFGDGRHPTTRLVLEGLDAWCAGKEPAQLQRLSGLDIGTGTGVLALALGRLGVGCVVAVDHAPGAVAEAMANVRLNRLEAVVTVTDRPLRDIRGRFALVAANLRPPSLMALAGHIADSLDPGGVVILSGFRPSEAAVVARPYLEQGMLAMSRRVKNGWAALDLQSSIPPVP